MTGEQNSKFENLIFCIKKNVKFLIFLLIFIITTIVSNLNIPAVNLFYGRGVALEYSILNFDNKKIDEIKEKIKQVGYPYFHVAVGEIDDIAFDVNNKPIKDILYVQIPTVLDLKDKDKINQISDIIFDKLDNSSLLGIKILGNVYSRPYAGFSYFVQILCLSLIAWTFILLIFFNRKENQIFAEYRKNVVVFLKNKYLDLIEFIKKVKEKGFGYFIKRLLFDEKDCDNSQSDVTLEIVKTIFFVIICVILIRYFIGELRWIPTGSMKNTIIEGDRVFVEKLDMPYKKEIKRGDILVFYPPEVKLSNNIFAIFSRLSGILCKDTAYIKRAIGLPNDKFEIKKDYISGEFRVYINDEPLDEPYVNSKTMWTECTQEMLCGPFVIPEKSYFMMGDNRGNSRDSRFWGFLDEDRIIGRANFMFFPFSRLNKLRDKFITLNYKKNNDEYVEKEYILNRYEFLFDIYSK